MKILVFSQYFWPENFRINDWCQGMLARGHQVTVLTGKPNYPSGNLDASYREKPQDYTDYGGVHVIRVPMMTRGQSNWRLALNYISFSLSASVIGLWKLRGKRFDVSFVFGASPITVALPAVLHGKVRRTPVVLWVLDLWPESLRAVGVVQSPWLLNLVGRAVTWLYMRCQVVLGQSNAFVASIKQRAPKHNEIGYAPNWSDQPAAQDAALIYAPEIQRNSRQFIIMFTGNVGVAQDFETILQAAALLKSHGIFRWVIVGEGRQLAWLQKEITTRDLADTVLTLGAFPLERMPSFYAHADCLLVTLTADELISKTVPGKVQAYLAFGRPLLAAINGETKNLIDALECGFAVHAGQAAELALAAEKLAQLSLSERTEMAARGQQHYGAHFEREKVLDQFERTLQNAVAAT